MDGGWLCTECAPVVTRKDDASRLWSTVRARDCIATGRGFMRCARGVGECEGLAKTGEVVVAGVREGEKGSEVRKLMSGAPVEWGVEMADNRWALVDEVSFSCLSIL